MKTVWGMAKVNWKHSKTAYIIIGLFTTILGTTVYIRDIVLSMTENELIAWGNLLYLLPLCLGICVPAQNFSKLMHLGGKRIDFFKSSLLTYAPAAAVTALISIVTHSTIDRWVISTGKVAGVLDLLDVFGFMARGPAAAFFQMTAFLMLVSCVAHTITLIQGRWYGWVTDLLIVAIISVFTPIAPLRAALVWFFNMIIFHKFAIEQILACVTVGAIVYGLSLIPIKSIAI